MEEARTVHKRTPDRYLHAHVYGDIIHKTQKCHRRFVDKQNVAYPFKGLLLFSKKRKEILTHATMWMHLKDILLNARRYKKVLYNSPHMEYLEEADLQRQKVD